MTFDEFMLDPVNTIYALTSSDLENISANISSASIVRLRKFFNEAMSIPLQSVTFKEKMLLVSNEHDYESFSLYGWPDTSKPDGLPYIKRDGFVNPEHLKGDKLSLRKMSYAVYILGLGYYLTKNKKYYRRLEEHIVHFFINKDTMMNPNLDHGQAMPGVNKGQRGGIIDFGVSFGYSLAILYALKQKSLLGNDLHKRFSKWLQLFKSWLLNSRLGLEMDKSLNNHSFVYDYLLLIISLFVDDTYYVEMIKIKYMSRCLAQIEEDGRMPLELKRTLSRNYFFMNMKLILEIGRLLKLDFDQYFRINKMLDYYLEHLDKWEYQQIKAFNKELDNYIYYIAFSSFGKKNHKLIKSDSISYLLFRDIMECYYDI